MKTPVKAYNTSLYGLAESSLVDGSGGRYNGRKLSPLNKFILGYWLDLTA